MKKTQREIEDERKQYGKLRRKIIESYEPEYHLDFDDDPFYIEDTGIVAPQQLEKAEMGVKGSVLGLSLRPAFAKATDKKINENK